MSDPVEFASRSPRYGLPMLFAGQAQKEFYVNEAHALADALLHPAIEGEANTPPDEPADGGCWLVGSSPTEAWSGHAGALASFQAGTWLFVEPRDGMRVLDRSTGQEIRFRRGWQAAGMTHLPQGGGVIDAEARATIDQLVEALIVGGVLSDNRIANGAFDGTIGWSQFLGDGSLTALDGRGMLKIASTFTVWGTPVATKVGTQYKLTVDVKTDSGASYWAVRKADDTDLDTQVVNLIQSWSGATTGDGQSAIFTATATRTYIALQANGAAGVEVHFANIRLEALA